MSRTIDCRYQDPLELIWLHALDQMGIRVVRESTVFAHWNGAGVLQIGTPEHLDPDDSLAQMVFHELCHGLVEGPESWDKPDWGLENLPTKRVHEYACLRLQAALADRHGLRDFLGSTTVFRDYYDALPEDPLRESREANAEEQKALRWAQIGWQRANADPWGGPLQEALERTAAVARIVSPLAGRQSLWRRAT